MVQPPTGTVTFLFTDIEGSTTLAQAQPETWPAMRARHHAILHSEAAAHAGHVFQIIGDAFCVAFATPASALDAAIDAQHVLVHEPWADARLRVRMGIHTGAAEWRVGNYEGYLTLARAKRIMSVAYGGQVLLSNATAELLRDQLPDGIRLRDVGEHRLKGLTNPERLWQLVAPDLPHDFPPLASLNTIANNLPIQVTSFVGREQERADLKRLLTTTRLLTLTGSGGTGKTRLALQVAADVLERFKDGVWFVELAPLSDPALVPTGVASVLGVREEQGRPLMLTLLDWLRDKQLLLMLDNCEHLLDACARFADAVLHGCRAAQLLATSREAFGIAGEVPVRVPSLATPAPHASISLEALRQYDAVRLFMERAQIVRPDYTLTNQNAPALAQICQRLDGIPLAIELAASRLKVLSLDDINRRLDDRFRLLTGGSRTALPRQQTLRALIDWSDGLLSEPERALLRRLSVFAGGWTLDAAEAVCASDGIESFDVLDLLTHLVDKSLVVMDERDGETRYRMLETIRQYAREKLLESGEGERVRNRHTDFCLRLAATAKPELRGPNQKTWLERLDLRFAHF